MGSEPSAESSPELPSRIGSYVIERELGRGGMGAVYVGVHDVIGKRAAVKVLLAAASRDDDLVQRFINEARAASQIRHPGIVEVFDYGNDDGRAYIVMELLDGMSLAQRMRAHGRLAIPAAVDIARQVAHALAAAHAAGIVHRDLKPDNIFLVPEPKRPSFGPSPPAGGDPTDRVVLLDFGIAKLTGIGAAISGARTVTGALLGTPQYMSPEQCEGGSEVDHRSDQYSLGCTLYHMLTGRLPFESTGLGGYIGAHLHVAPPPLDVYCPAGSRQLAAIVARLLAKAPGDRYASAEELARALEAPGVDDVVRPPPIPSTPSASTTISAPPPRRRRAGLAVVLLVAALAIGVGIALLVKSLGDEPPERVARTIVVDEPNRGKHVDDPPEEREPVVVPLHEDGNASERPPLPPPDRAERATRIARDVPAKVDRRDTVLEADRAEPRTEKVEPKRTTTTNAEAEAIIKADRRTALELCKKTPPDRPATIRPCMIAACEAGDTELAKAWFMRAVGKATTRPHAVDGLNDCQARGVKLHPI